MYTLFMCYKQMVFTVDLTKGNEIHESPKKDCGLRSISNRIKCPFGGRMHPNSLQNLRKNPSWPDSNFLLRTPVHSNFHVRLLGHRGASAPGFHFFPWFQYCFCSWSLKTRFDIAAAFASLLLATVTQHETLCGFSERGSAGAQAPPNDSLL